MGSAAGVEKAWAARLGLTLAEYQDQVRAGNKWCGGCRNWHTLSAFGSDRSRYDGLASRCAKSRVTTKDRPGVHERRLRAAQGLAWCRGCRAWLTASLVRQGACATHRNEEWRQRYAVNPHLIRARVSARRRNLDVVPPWWREVQFETFSGLCAYGCGRRATALDHVWPVVKGGKSRPDNLVPACTTCNSSKKDGDPAPWLDRLAAAYPEQWVDFMDLNMVHAGPFDTTDGAGYEAVAS